eukprot:5800589-Amphidinium_carterae.1
MHANRLIRCWLARRTAGSANCMECCNSSSGKKWEFCGLVGGPYSCIADTCATSRTSNLIDTRLQCVGGDLVDHVAVDEQKRELDLFVGCEARCAGGRQVDELPRKCCNAAKHARAASKARRDTQAASKAKDGTHALLERKLLLLGAAHAAAATQTAAAWLEAWQHNSIACGPGKTSMASTASKQAAGVDNQM